MMIKLGLRTNPVRLFILILVQSIGFHIFSAMAESKNVDICRFAQYPKIIAKHHLASEDVSEIEKRKSLSSILFEIENVYLKLIHMKDSGLDVNFYSSPGSVFPGNVCGAIIPININGEPSNRSDFHFYPSKTYSIAVFLEGDKKICVTNVFMECRDIK